MEHDTAELFPLPQRTGTVFRCTKTEEHFDILEDNVERAASSLASGCCWVLLPDFGWWYTATLVQKLLWGTTRIKILEWFFSKSAFEVLKNLWQGMRKKRTTNLSSSGVETCTNMDVQRAKSDQPVNLFHLRQNRSAK